MHSDHLLKDALNSYSVAVQETVASTTAQDMPHNTGEPSRPTVSTPDDRSRLASLFPDTAADVGDSSLLDSDHLGPAADATEELWNDGSALSTVHDTSTSEDGLTTEEEIDAVVRVGIVSPDAAMRMTRLVEKLKSEGSSPRTVKKVYVTFLKWVDYGATCSDIGSGGMTIDDD
ncbi:hypothetical protein FN846DRAFT_887398 [Sphaerosporella brunnea]|uniref:Uncharacterized protein n=1 Tax=Sphaerosporella brunnea TaxID=1250544 RepID=A0A5J5F612_9PEZI|nr:hypothetical protein FN846DRAFT_887398 [Sphaerosporella brunnea]